VIISGTDEPIWMNFNFKKMCPLCEVLGKVDRGLTTGAILVEGNRVHFFLSLCHASDRVLPALLHMRFRRQKIGFRIGSDRFVAEFEFSTPYGG